MSWSIVLALFLLFDCGSSSNILWIVGLASPSHQIWAGTLQKALALRGHNITSLSVDVDSKPTPNITFIHMENVYDHYAKSTINYSSLMEANSVDTIMMLNEFRTECCIPAFKSEGLATLMRYPRDFKFDLIVHDFVGAQCLLGLVKRFGKPPLISASASTCPIAIAAASGNPQYPGIVPANQLNQAYNMNWYHRLYNIFLYTCDNVLRMNSMHPKQNEMARSYFKDAKLDVMAISRSSALTLVNLPPYEVMQPFYQSVIPVGGLNIVPPSKLDKVLSEFIDGAKDGVIYFALGTNLNPKLFPPRRAAFFLEAFSRLPNCRILWKYDPYLLQHPLPANVLVRKWLPQNDILAHPKTMVFIGHGGALSSHEAVWHAVPQLLIPFMIDQRQNAARAAERGIAIVLRQERLSADAIFSALKRLITEYWYKESVTRLSEIFRDQPQTPMERAVFWVEYVIRNRENLKLRSPGQDGQTLERFSLHVMVTLAVLVCTQLMFCLMCYSSFKLYY